MLLHHYQIGPFCEFFHEFMYMVSILSMSLASPWHNRFKKLSQIPVDVTGGNFNKPFGDGFLKFNLNRQLAPQILLFFKSISPNFGLELFKTQLVYKDIVHITSYFMT